MSRSLGVESEHYTSPIFLLCVKRSPPGFIVNLLHDDVPHQVPDPQQISLLSIEY